MALSDVSNITKVKSNFAIYKGNDNAIIKPSTRNGKKFMVIYDNKTTHFGDINSPDYTKTNDNTKKNAYLARATKIKGEWKKNKYSANNLAINLLWK